MASEEIKTAPRVKVDMLHPCNVLEINRSEVIHITYDMDGVMLLFDLSPSFLSVSHHLH